MSTIGDALRAAREAGGQSVDDMAAAMDLPVEWLKDLEEGHFAAFGNEVHAQAAIRLYATRLGLQPDRLLGMESPLVTRTGASFEPRVAQEPTRSDVLRAAVNASLRAPDSIKQIGIIAGLELLAGLGLLIVRGLS